MGHAGSTSGGDSSEMVIYHLNSLAGSRASGQPPAASGSNAESQGVTSSVDLMPCTPAVAFHVPRMVRNKQSVQQLDGEVGFGTAESGHSAKHFAADGCCLAAAIIRPFAQLALTVRSSCTTRQEHPSDADLPGCSGVPAGPTTEPGAHSPAAGVENQLPPTSVCNS